MKIELSNDELACLCRELETGKKPLRAKHVLAIGELRERLLKILSEHESGKPVVISTGVDVDFRDDLVDGASKLAVSLSEYLRQVLEAGKTALDKSDA